MGSGSVLQRLATQCSSWHRSCYLTSASRSLGDMDLLASKRLFTYGSSASTSTFKLPTQMRSFDELFLACVSFLWSPRSVFMPPTMGFQENTLFILNHSVFLNKENSAKQSLSCDTSRTSFCSKSMHDEMRRGRAAFTSMSVLLGRRICNQFSDFVLIPIDR